MPGDLDYAHEKFSAGRSTLAEGRLDLRGRLWDAYISQVMNTSPLLDGLGPPIDDELADRIDAFHRRFERQTEIRAAVDAMTDDEVDSAVRELLSIAYELDRCYYPLHAD